MIYLDNAATSWPKPAGVARSVSAALTRCAGNPGRTSHHLAMDAAALIQECRENLAQLFRITNPLRICFTSLNCMWCKTHAAISSICFLGNRSRFKMARASSAPVFSWP